MILTMDKLVAALFSIISGLVLLHVKQKFNRQEEQERKLDRVEADLHAVRSQHYTCEEVEAVVDRAMKPLAESIRDLKQDLKSANDRIINLLSK